MVDSPNKIQWHPGFYGAAELELHGNLTQLSFQTEVELSKKPLRVDLLVIKTEPGTIIDNEAGKLFRRYNIIEYKSPDDSLTIDDFYKTIGYACLYKGLGRTLNQFPADEITVSLFRDAYPRDMFKELKASGKLIEKKYPGIYYVSGRLPFDMQVVVTSQLNAQGHSAFRILSNRARMEDVRKFIEEAGRYTDPGDRENAEAVLQVSISANKALYEDVRRDSDMCEALENLMQDVIEKRVEQKVEQRMQQVQQEVQQQVQQEAEQRVQQAQKQADQRVQQAQKQAQQQAQQTTLGNLRSMMSTLKITAEQAMDALQIPPSEQSMYLREIR